MISNLGLTDTQSAAVWPSPTAGLGALQRYVLRALDEIDYGILIVDAHRHILHANHQARQNLSNGPWLTAHGGQLAARTPSHQADIVNAIGRACKGGRSLVALSGNQPPSVSSSIAFIPLEPGNDAQAAPVLVILCRTSVCEQLSLHFYAQNHGLTRSEEGILAALAQGLDVDEIAKTRNLTESTVRCYVKQLRIKTHSSSMRDLLGKISVLPPVVSAMKDSGWN